MRKEHKNPKGGLTAAGRAHFKRTEGANLKPGVKGAADTPEKMRRKGSWAVRHYGGKAKPLPADKGRPTRNSLHSKARGGPVTTSHTHAPLLPETGPHLMETTQSRA